MLITVQYKGAKDGAFLGKMVPAVRCIPSRRKNGMGCRFHQG
ncbi:hypothetical protein [Flavobacterium granuli]|uniref:Uncharacterized protein n=1 Tax=Flavobacterium granuli TaxID=280093 RepID=A0ABU1S6E3_9FLAO|nr:hypothetical protein [Flavobacterium granuli]MDR6846593.1 hypothetical protein [Flavobacterium granuli]